MSTAAAMPADVRLMNIAATALFAIGLAVLVAAAAWWTLRHPLFAVSAITVEGDVSHNSAATLRANVAPRLAGNFFTVNLRAARDAFQAAPWVRQAVVRREFPNRLRVQLQEHQAVALWGEHESRMVNSFGEVFEANVGDVESEALPRLNGPQGQSAQVLQMHGALAPLFEPVDGVLEQLELSARGGWRAQLDSGAVIELGRGTLDEVVPRVQRFVRTLTQVTAKYGRRPGSVESADLRHADGYALRLRGVTTVVTDAPKKP